MSIEAWFTIGVTIFCLVLMASNRTTADLALMAGVTLLLLAGVLTPTQALAGMANEGMITIGVLYVVVSGLRETGAINWLGQNLLGKPKSLMGAQTRLMTPVAMMSALMNNTPVVAMFIPAVSDWARKNNVSASKLMMPLSYAAIVGGTCTLIGTSTNLVVNGLIIDNTKHPGLGLFDLIWIGLPLTIITILFVLFGSKWLLPERRTAHTQFADVRRYTVEMMVEKNSPLEGKSVEQAGLRQLPGLYLVEIDRGGQVMAAVSPHEKLMGGDRLIFAGVIDSVVDLQKIRGLQPATDQVFKLDSPRESRMLVEAVVSNSCPLVGKTIREGRFRTVYNSAIIAVSRSGEAIQKKIGDIVLKQGDTLLLETHQSFIEQQRNSRDFYLVSGLHDSAPPRHDKALLSLIILVAMVVCVAFEVLSMLKAAMLAAGIMIITRCTTGRIARRNVDWQVLIAIAASFGIGNALQSSGAAQAIAETMIGFSGGSAIMAMSLIFILTALFTAVATNNAAAVLMFPIALASAESLGVDFIPFAITIMIAASASFATPIGYQTNLMVLGPGGYQFSDYIRMGVPLTIILGIATIIIVPLVWGF